MKRVEVPTTSYFESHQVTDIFEVMTGESQKPKPPANENEELITGTKTKQVEKEYQKKLSRINLQKVCYH